MEVPYSIFGYIGSGLLATLLWPQVYTTFKTKNVEGLSSAFLLLEIVATCFWVLYGIGFLVNGYTGDGIIILLSNSSLFICSVLLLLGKHRFSKKKVENEMEPSISV